LLAPTTTPAAGVPPRGLGRLLGKLGLVAGIVLAASAFLYFKLPRNPHSYYRGFALKDNLLRQTPSPRVIICGGSNCALGIDSQLLAKGLQREAINTGLHAGFGLSFMLRSVQAHLRQGDILILCPEYSLLTPSGWRGDDDLCRLVFQEPVAVRYLSTANLPTLVHGLGRVLGAQLPRLLAPGSRFRTDPIYCATAFNAHGDVVSHLNQEPERWIPGGAEPACDEAIIRRLKTFTDECQSRGVIVRILPPCIREIEYQKNHAVINATYQAIRSTCPSITLARPEDFAYPADFFFDTQYHLNNLGRKTRTEQLLNEIRLSQKTLTQTPRTELTPVSPHEVK